MGVKQMSIQMFQLLTYILLSGMKKPLRLVNDKPYHIVGNACALHSIGISF